MVKTSVRHGSTGSRPRQPILRRRAILSVELLEDRSLLSTSYGFEALAYLGDPAPAGGQYDFDFEATAINNRGQVAYGADLTLGGEGIFVMNQNGQSAALARVGDPAPGTDTTYGPFFLTGPSMNDSGDVAFNFKLEPLTVPYWRNTGVFRYTDATQQVTPVMLPGMAAPGGGEFVGTHFQTSLNYRGDVAFPGLFSGGPEIINQDLIKFGYKGLGFGVFTADKLGQSSLVVRTGDAAPGGGTFDFVGYPWINDRGDVAFQGQLASKKTAVSNVNLKSAGGQLITIAQAGDVIPSGGTFAGVFGPIVNYNRQVVFSGITSLDPRFESGIFLWDQGNIITVARPGTAMPGGGTLVNASASLTFDLNERGDVIFTGAVDKDGDQVPDATGLFVWSNGSLGVVAETGTVIPGVGTIDQLLPPALVGSFPGYSFTDYAASNDRGQILFTAAMQDGSGVLLRASPRQPLLAASLPSSSLNASVTQSQLQPLLAEAVRRLEAAGVDTSALGNIQVEISNLGGRTLGMASGHTIYLDDNAAGWGWFVDRTPADDSEFTIPGNQGEQNRMDLLTVLEHELGHLLGNDHSEDGLMADTLAAGVRRMPMGGTDWLAAVEAVFFESSSFKRRP